jgi:hypothetical protein
MPQPPETNLRFNSSEGFRGFALPTSNTTYTPNQFFDVCLPHHSRGCVRLVAFLIRKTLGWCDADGNPQTERHLVSYADLEGAGINRDMIHAAIDEAIRYHFIRCVRSPSIQRAGQRAASGLYELKWDESGDYIKDPEKFRGFFIGEGNRTYIPNQFFDLLIPAETLAVIKVVGSIIRFSIGYQNKWGHRRQNVSLSFQHIQNYTRLKDRTTLSKAVRYAMKSNFIERVEEGYFDPDAGKLSKAAVYAVKWLSQNTDTLNGRKTLPGISSLLERSEMPTGNGRKTRPGERSENPTDIEIKQINKTLKQQETGESAASFEKLKEAGFDDVAAKAMAKRFSFDRIDRQITWMAGRKFKSNRLGMLRKAIEQDWQAPGGGSGKLGQPNFDRSSRRGESFEGALASVKSRFWDQPSN